MILAGFFFSKRNVAALIPLITVTNRFLILNALAGLNAQTGEQIRLKHVNASLLANGLSGERKETRSLSVTTSQGVVMICTAHPILCG